MMRLTYSKPELWAVALLAALVSSWAAVAAEAFSPAVLLACEAMFFAFYLAGSLVAGVQPVARGLLFDLPLRLLVGYGVINTALLGLAWISPLGIIANFSLLFGCLLLVGYLAGKPQRVSTKAPSLWVVAICAVATTLWCQDSISPIIKQEGMVTFKPWVDGFYHAVHIRIFAESHGAFSIEDFRIAGVPARLYHYGAYLLPAFIKQVSAVHSYSAFAGILAPVGVLFTGLSAYAFFGSIWGSWPGLAAACALLLFPDGAQQGMQNPFMSYHWLTQISPSATYGLALLAVAWLFVLQGTSRGSWTQLCVGWFVAGLVVAYKLHYVVASAFLLLLVPALFFKAKFGWPKRALWVLSAGLFYVTALTLGQKVPGVPRIVFDGSSIGEILHLVSTFALPGPFKDYMVEHIGRPFPVASNLALGIPYILGTGLGIFLPLLVLLVVLLRKQLAPIHLIFPLLLIAQFVLMFFGLALDFESSTPDELSHRPFMIVYFFVVAWVGGALGHLLANSKRLARFAPQVLLGVAALLTIVPTSLGEGVQRMWVMPKISPLRLPSSVLDVAEFLRTNSEPTELYQDSQFDRMYAIAALSERKTFVAHTLTLMPYRAELVNTRSAAVDDLMALRLPKLVRATARAHGIRWFIVQQGNRVNWLPELKDKPALVAGPFAVYDLK